MCRMEDFVAPLKKNYHQERVLEYDVCLPRSFYKTRFILNLRSFIMGRVQILVILLFFALVSVFSFTTKYCSGKFNGINYCEYQVGDLKSNIVISAPQGGILEPPSIRNRSIRGCKNIDGSCTWRNDCGVPVNTSCKTVQVTDKYTIEMTRLLAERIKSEIGVRPHIIMFNLRRTKTDANREVEQATFGEPEAVTAYNEFHGFIKEARSGVVGRGLYIDMHGQRHPDGWIELGYLIKKDNLNIDNMHGDKSSLKHLAYVFKDKYIFEDIVYGKDSLGTYLQQEGYNTIPSGCNKKPGMDGGYYAGGYNTQTYGSRLTGKIDGIQIETHAQYRNAEKYENYTKALGRSIAKFWRKYDYDKPDTSGGDISALGRSDFICVVFSCLFVLFYAS